MKYRKFGSLDWQVSVLGFGAMRLPVINGQQANINEPEAIRMIHHALDNGVNYIDTAYLYHMGNSEKLVGKALKDGYRQKTRITTKLPARMIEKADDFDRILNEQLERLDVDKIDFYLLHGLSKDSWHKVRDFRVLDWAEKQMAKGYFDRLGFSFHDEYDVFKEIVDAYDNWVLAQVLYNFMDKDTQATTKGVKYAAGKGLAVVVMEPLRGGLLAKEPPEPVAKEWAKSSRKFQPVEWAFHWVWDQPEITLALSGMSAMEQVVQNLEIADAARAGILTEADQAIIGRVRKAYRSIRPIKCSDCKYCIPCPNNVDIPAIFQIYDDAMMYQDAHIGQFRYNGPFGLDQDQRADKCTECGECLEKCPQHIDIPNWLKKVHEELYLENPPGPPRPSAPAKKEE
jgi:predicted aldo/keto reductase-like oxidoreductase